MNVKIRAITEGEIGNAPFLAGMQAAVLGPSTTTTNTALNATGLAGYLSPSFSKSTGRVARDPGEER